MGQALSWFLGRPGQRADTAENENRSLEHDGEGETIGMISLRTLL